MMLRKRLRLIIALLVVLAAVLIVLGTRPKGQLTIQVAPASSAVSINGKPASAGTFKKSPGQYTVTASHAGFAAYTKSVTVSKGSSEYVGMVLGSNSPDTANWYQSHPDDQQLAQIIGGKNFDLGAQQQAQKNPLIKSLPFVDQFYRIDYGQSQKSPNDPNAAGIYITFYSQAGKQQALDWLKFKGYDPSKLEIIYKDKSGPGL